MRFGQPMTLKKGKFKGELVYCTDVCFFGLVAVVGSLEVPRHHTPIWNLKEKSR